MLFISYILTTVAIISLVIFTIIHIKRIVDCKTKEIHEKLLDDIHNNFYSIKFIF